MTSKNCDNNSDISILCRPGCAACCIAPSISSAIPGMETGKPSGVRCLQLTDKNLCALFGKESRPAVCSNLQPTLEMCGNNNEDAFKYLKNLETLTTPDKKSRLHF